MDESFFVKYAIQIKKQKNSKEEVLLFIKERTGIELQEEMITISKKQLTFTVSSIVKQRLYQKNVNSLLEEKGYTVKF
jgi:hypothetical protein